MAGRVHIGVVSDPETFVWVRAAAKRAGKPLARFVGDLLAEARVRDTAGAETPPEAPEWVSSDPDALEALLGLFDVPEPPRVGLEEVVRKIENPGDYLDDETQSEIEALGTLASMELKVIEDARERRYEIIASWGNTLAEMLLETKRLREKKDNSNSLRQRRVLNRNLLKVERQITDFRSKIRARCRPGYNIPTTIEDAERLLDRRKNDKQRHLIVLEGARKVS